MFLAIDIGNTNITLGIFRGEILGPRWRFASDHDTSPDEYGTSILQALNRADVLAGNIHAIAIASVVPPLTHTLGAACEKYMQCRPFLVDSTVNTGLRLRYEDPRQIGVDRIVDAAAAFRLYGGPACVIDFGTATTFDAVSADGDYLGGAIAPGIGIAAEALSQKAAKLPKVDLHRPPAAIGRNVVHSLQSGLLLGYVGLVEGMVARFHAELGTDMKVIATGGLAEVIAAETKVISILAPWLTLDGLRIIHALNIEEP